MFLPARLEAIRSPLEIWSAEMTLNWIPRFLRNIFNEGRSAFFMASRMEGACRTITLKPKRRRKGGGRGRPGPHLPQHFLYFLPLPHGQGSFRPILGGAT